MCHIGCSRRGNTRTCLECLNVENEVQSMETLHSILRENIISDNADFTKDDVPICGIPVSGPQVYYD